MTWPIVFITYREIQFTSIIIILYERWNMHTYTPDKYTRKSANKNSGVGCMLCIEIDIVMKFNIQTIIRWWPSLQMATHFIHFTFKRTIKLCFQWKVVVYCSSKRHYIIITGSPAGLSRVNGVRRSNAETWNFNPSPKAQFYINWFQIWRRR